VASREPPAFGRWLPCRASPHAGRAFRSLLGECRRIEHGDASAAAKGEHLSLMVHQSIASQSHQTAAKDEAPYVPPAGMRSCRRAIRFESFRLFPTERLLEKAGIPVHLPGRALDILIVLIECAGEVVKHQDLISRVWQDVTVVPGALRVHITSLRKALGEGQSSTRFVSNIPGRGYSFVVPVAYETLPFETALERSDGVGRNNLPPRLAHVIGRDDVIDAMITQMRLRRLVTLVGPGGIGKTTVAIAAGHAMLGEFNGAVRFVDLGSLNNPNLVAITVANALGVALNAHRPVPSLIDFLSDSRLLLILDCCEYVMDAAATLAELIVARTKEIYILATSREALKVEGESVFRLDPLQCPPDQAIMTIEGAVEFAAAQLFVDRVHANLRLRELCDLDAPIIGEICRRLDGIPLAIELAAGMVEAFGMQGIVEFLYGGFRLQWRGRRTAVPRHRTLTAMLDWSYDLLSEKERAVLRRLSVFAGIFFLEAAQSIGIGDGGDDAEFLDIIATLVSKSLVVANDDHSVMRYRLLDTTRAYALARLDESGERHIINRRHAVYYRDFLPTKNSSSSEMPTLQGLRLLGEHLDNVRVALQWSFSACGDAALGIALAQAWTPSMLADSLVAECLDWAERSIAALDDTTRGTRQEMDLQAMLGHSLMFTKGNSEQVRAAFKRGLDIALALREPLDQLRLIARLHGYLMRVGQVKSALALASRAETIAQATADAASIALAKSLLCGIHHHLGDQSRALAYRRSAMERTPSSLRAYSLRNGELSVMARILWLQGSSDQAVATAQQAIEDAECLGHPLLLCVLLVWVIPVALWAGNQTCAERLIARLTTLAEMPQCESYRSYVTGFRGELSIARGEVEVGVASLRACLTSLPADRFETLVPVFETALAKGLSMLGEHDEALTIIDAALVRAEQGGWLLYTPDMLCVKGNILASMLPSLLIEAERSYQKALEMARSQSALAWELRAVVCLARCWVGQDRIDPARELLASVYDRFTEGFNSTDLRTAHLLLDELGQRGDRSGAEPAELTS
jgi:predicted ATPase/DNA-binding winged helix-turn-helix (wHTH) protein